jgi:hypothetical protein
LYYRILFLCSICPLPWLLCFLLRFPSLHTAVLPLPPLVWETCRNYFPHFRVVCFNNNSLCLLESVSSKLHICGWLIIDKRQNWISCGPMWEFAFHGMRHKQRWAVSISQGLTSTFQLWLTVDQNSFRKVHICYAGSEISTLARIPNVYYLFHKMVFLDPILSELNPVRDLMLRGKLGPVLN